MEPMNVVLVWVEIGLIGMFYRKGKEIISPREFQVRHQLEENIAKRNSSVKNLVCVEKGGRERKKKGRKDCARYIIIKQRIWLAGAPEIQEINATQESRPL